MRLRDAGDELPTAQSRPDPPLAKGRNLSSLLPAAGGGVPGSCCAAALTGNPGHPARPLGLRAYLLALVLAVLLPALGLGAATTWHMAGLYRTAAEQRLSDAAAALAVAIDREIEVHVTALGALAASPLFDDPDSDLAAFAMQAHSAAAALGASFVVVGPDRRQRLDTARLATMAGSALDSAEAVRAAFATDRPVVSGLVTDDGATSAGPVARLFVPVRREGRAIAVIATRLDPLRLSGLLATTAASSDAGAVATLVDGRGTIVAHSRDAITSIGRLAPDWLPRAAADHAAGLLAGHTLAGQAVIVAFQRIAGAPGWTVAVIERLAAHRAGWLYPLALLIAGGAATLLVALAVAAWLAQRILRPIYALTREAEITSVGGAVEGRAGAPGQEGPADGGSRIEGLRLPVAEFEQLRQSLRRAEARRALLLREVDHRAKNALAVVQSVVRLTSAEEPRAYAAAVQARVAALARAHALLAESGWAGADLRGLTERELAPYSLPEPETPWAKAIALDGPPIRIAAAAVQPLAMVLHELAANAARHGALSVPGGSVTLSWRLDRPGAGGGGRLRLRWAETGGPPVVGAPARRGLGARLIEATIRGQLGGSLQWHWDRVGLVADITLPFAQVQGGKRGDENGGAAFALSSGTARAVPGTAD